MEIAFKNQKFVELPISHSALKVLWKNLSAKLLAFSLPLLL